MRFSELLTVLPPELEPSFLASGNCASEEITSITCDSRKARPNSVFVALRGNDADGHDFIRDALARGCRHVIVEDADVAVPENDCCMVRVADSRRVPGLMAAEMEKHPARSMTMIGLTGTNGKTTVSWMIEQMLVGCGHRVGVIGTVNYRYRDISGAEIVLPAPLTTPDSVFLQGLLRKMAESGVTHVVMETSSHALVQRRLEGVQFDVALFTNLSRDHLDFHRSMDAYFAAKKLLFTRYLKKNGRMVIVTDKGGRKEDPGAVLARELAKNGQHRVITCSLDEAATVRAEKVGRDINGFDCTLVAGKHKTSFHSSLAGRYNLLNVLAAVGAGLALDLDISRAVRALQQLDSVPGRLERVRLDGTGENSGLPAVFVDYAHTPDALDNVLQTLRELARGRVVCVFGCGGDRDRGKRHLMGAVAAKLADVVVVTSDNPRSEDPESIIDDILPGLQGSDFRELEPEQLFSGISGRGWIRISDRREAIRTGISASGPGDIVLIAGKGHEDYQILGRERIFFDDRLEAADGLLTWNTHHLIRATDGLLAGGGQRCLLRNISTDTRSVASGDVFVALVGENFDGHDFVDQAVSAGAGAVIVSRQPSEGTHGVPIILVRDTLRALGDLAAYRRRLLGRDLQVVAVTGSSGKTTVKEMTAAVFRRHLHALRTGHDPLLKTGGNFNNLVGLPLSLLPVDSGHKTAVLEMGMNRPGEIARLTEIAGPDIGCITNVQAAHLEGLGSIEGVARAKGELFSGLEKKSTAVVNYDSPLVRRLPRSAQRVVGFAVTPSGRRHKPMVRATRINSLGAEGMRFTLHIGDRNKRITVSTPGKHNVSNCAAAAATAHAAGIAPETIFAALQDFTNIDRRMQFMTLAGGIQVLNDCYNANPGSMAAALETVRGFGERDCRRVAVLGDMLELGRESESAHRKIGRQAAEQGYDFLVLVGEFADHAAQGAEEAGLDRQRTFCFGTTLEAADWLYRAMIAGRIRSGDWLLVKGSRGMRMEKILDELAHRFDTGITGGEA
jgi:murE/murF fusion protein